MKGKGLKIKKEKMHKYRKIKTVEKKVGEIGNKYINILYRQCWTPGVTPPPPHPH